MSYGQFDKDIEDLREFGKGVHKELTEEFESKKKDHNKIVRRNTIYIIGLTIFGFYLAYYAYSIEESDVLYALFPFILILKFLRTEEFEFQGAFKERIMQQLCHRLNFQYTYRPDKKDIIPFGGLSIIPTVEYLSLADKISGKVGAIDFNLFEARIEKDSVLVESTTSFSGILAEYDYLKGCEGATSITRKDAPYSIIPNKKIGDKVKVENSDFNEIYNVHSTRPDKIDELLTAEVIETILGLERKISKSKLQLAFYDNKIFISMQRNRDYFEGGHLQFHNPDYIQNNITDLTIIFFIINELKLSTETKG